MTESPKPTSAQQHSPVQGRLLLAALLTLLIFYWVVYERLDLLSLKSQASSFDEVNASFVDSLLLQGPGLVVFVPLLRNLLLLRSQKSRAQKAVLFVASISFITLLVLFSFR